MGTTSGVDPIELMLQVIRDNTPEDIWQDQPLVSYRLLGNTNRGEVGEQFIRRYLLAAGIKAGNGNRTSSTDMTIGKAAVEVKTASLGANGTFQFNHIRLDKRYSHLVCLGVCPDEIVYNAWRKGELAEDKAGRLVRMAEGQSVTFKLTKRSDEMLPIERIIEWARGVREEA
ncbi:MAG: hypothetical protein OXQ89_04470 [Rhodospirillaceae bacterium]|nr:hypothetical protein [Rhodospirillaceae bacterium]